MTEGMLDKMLREHLQPLIPDWAATDVKGYATAVGLLATLKGGVVVGGLRLDINVTPYNEDEEEGEENDPTEEVQRMTINRPDAIRTVRNTWREFVKFDGDASNHKDETLALYKCIEVTEEQLNTIDGANDDVITACRAIRTAMTREAFGVLPANIPAGTGVNLANSAGQLVKNLRA